MFAGMGEEESDLQKEYRELSRKENRNGAISYLVVFILIPSIGIWKWNWDEVDAMASVLVCALLISFHEKTKKYSKD
jgi:uncharacterized membrane protein YkgB